MKKTFKFQKGSPKNRGFYLLKLKKKSKFKIYRTYDVDLFDLTKGWNSWNDFDIEGWAELGD